MLPSTPLEEIGAMFLIFSCLGRRTYPCWDLILEQEARSFGSETSDLRIVLVHIVSCN